MKIVECVPNISEGRDRKKIDAIVAAAAGVAGVTILDVDPGADTNRTVITFVGDPEAVLEGAFQLIQASANLIDMRSHTGAHPRMGATDVCPFIPVSGATMDECAELARRLGKRVAEELKIPVYLYERAASRESRRSLAEVRKGEYEGLADKIKQPDWKPDFGPAQFHPGFGAAIIGARPFLIAYNVNLNTKNKSLASQIANRIREQGSKTRDANGNFIKDAQGNFVMSPGRLKSCRAVGWYIPEYGCAQVSINLTDFNVTGIHDAFDACVEEAAQLGLRVTGSEIVGLVPRDALLASGRHYAEKQKAYPGLEQIELIDLAIRSLGLSEIAKFDPQERIIEEKLAAVAGISRPLAALSVSGFIREVGSDSVAPGGGSVAALAGSLAASLGNMVCGLTYKQTKASTDVRQHAAKVGRELAQLQQACGELIDDDTTAFQKVIEALRAVPKTTPDDEPEKQAALAAVENAYLTACTVPQTTLRSAKRALLLIEELAAFGMESALSDMAVAVEAALAAAVGGAWNVRINLRELKNQTTRDRLNSEIESDLIEVQAIASRTRQALATRFR